MSSGNALLGNPIVKDLLICTLCSRFFNDPRVLPCQHTFCLSCLQKQFQTTHASSRVRLSSMRCPTCFSAAAIPIRGINSFPSDKKVEKVKELVEGVMMTGLLRKSRVETLEGRPRAGSKSRPSSWTGNIDILTGNGIEDLNNTFPGALSELNVENIVPRPQTREVGTDTNDDGHDYVIENDTQKSSSEECGIQTDIGGDIAKNLVFEKLGGNINGVSSSNVEEGFDNMDSSGGRKRMRDIRLNQNGVSHNKRTCTDSELTDKDNNNMKENSTRQPQQHQSSSDPNNVEFDMNNDGVQFSSNDSTKTNSNHDQNGIYNGRESNSSSKSSEADRCNNKHSSDGLSKGEACSMDTSSHCEEPCDNDMDKCDGEINVDNEDFVNGETIEQDDAIPPVYTAEPILLWSVEKEEYDMPTDIKIASNGNIIVSEYGNGKLQFYESSGHYIQSVDEVKPFSIAMNKEDDIVVADRRDKTVKVFHQQGDLSYKWDDNCFHWISGISVTSQGNFVVFDRGDCKIGVFTPEGERIHQFGHYGDGDSHLCMADFLTVDAHDRILVCDSGHHCVKVYDLNGTFLGRFGERGTSEGYLLWPKSVSVDSADNILVSDQKNKRISLFSPDGRFIQTILNTKSSPFNIGFSDSGVLAVTNFALTGHSEISVYQI